MSISQLSVDGTESITVVTIRRKLNTFARDIFGASDLGKQASDDAAHLPLFQARLERARQAWTKFRKIWDVLDETYVKAGEGDKFPSEADKEFYNAVADEMDISNGYAHISRKWEPLSPRAEPSTSTIIQQTTRHLPRVSLPSFSGDLVGWRNFSDTFKSLVHEDPGLSDVEKFNYLKTSLKGEASTLVMRLSVTGETYKQAWKILQDAYDNPRVLASRYIKLALDYRRASTKPSLETYQSYLSGVVDNLESFKNLDLQDSSDFLLTLIALRALDSETRKEFELAHLDTELPGTDDVFGYIRNRIKALRLSGDGKVSDLLPSSNTQDKWRSGKHDIPSRESKRYSGSTFHTSSASSNKPSLSVNAKHWKGRVQPPSKPTQSRLNPKPCSFCQREHELFRCFKFTELPQSKRADFVKAKKGCVNCLREGHNSQECPSKISCKFCQRRHHSLLHEESPTPAQQTFMASGNMMHARQGSSAPPSKLVLLGTAQVIIQSSSGKTLIARAALDSCSEHTFISASLAERLRCELQTHFEGGLTGLGDVSLNRPSGVACCSIFGGGTEFPIDAIVVDSITSRMPSNPVPAGMIGEVANYELADPLFGRPAPIDVLIGADIYVQLLTGAPIKTSQPGICLLPTVFGLVVAGSTKTQVSSGCRAMMTLDSSPSIEEMLKKFWEMEEPRHCKQEDPEDLYCRQHFDDNTSRDDTGRFVVRLPVKPDSEPCGNNRDLVARRFFSLEKRLQGDSELREHYVGFMREYLDLGHMSVASSPASYVIPHHGIWQESQGKKKLRVVFDASCPSPAARPGGCALSLNDTLFTGPKVQPDLTDILTRFRMHAIVLTADIVKMYRQILVHPEQRKLQHIFWREDPSLPLVEMELNTLTYGEGPCSFLAVSTVAHLARMSSKTCPLASSKVLTDMYIDDFVSGVDTMEEAIQLRNELSKLFESGGFTLGKWSSNVPSLVHKGDSTQVTLPMSDTQSSVIKILGMIWDSHSDIFSYSVIAPELEATKRSLLSAIARTFDPLGLLAPVIFKAKCIIQDLWKEKLDWDDPLPHDLSTSWKSIAEEWRLLEGVSVPRYIARPECKLMLVGFCDASERGYAGAVYLRSEKNGLVQVNLVKAKTKVAPTKSTPIARLELCGALLLARLLSSIRIPNCDFKDTRCFTDSMVVLAWLRIPAYRLKTYEANRVSAILESTPLSFWQHVRTEENPSDIASRGCAPGQLLSCPKWWQGPSWLKRSVREWPAVTEENSPNCEERIGQAFATTTQRVAKENPVLALIERFSSLRLLIRTVACILRLTRRDQSERRTGPVTAEEYRLALRRCVMITQRHLLPHDVCNAKTNSSLFKELSPFVDEDGIVRVGGRLRHSSLSRSHKHPVLLPRDAHLSRLVITDTHSRNLHPGPTLTLALVRTNFWIPGGLRTVKGITSRCVKCRIQNAEPIQPIMGDIPKERLSPLKAFNETGVDFAGPFTIRESKRRGGLRKPEFRERAYLRIFVCMASRAVHLECVTSLTTTAFLATLDRFVARRGAPSVIRSDNGTNFVGASRYLKDLFQFLKTVEPEIIDSLSPKGIEWCFIPPRAPHFGGSWEAAVKSAKKLLAHSIGSQNFTYEELSTVFIKIEGLLNSRPLCPLTDDVDCWEFLTPGHFLAGAPTRPIPEVMDEHQINPIARWDIVKKQVEQVWSRWRLEYLHHLQQRKKWDRPGGDLRVGDLVILIEKRRVPGYWPVARVVDIHPGPDSVVRVVSVRTSSGAIFKRPVTKLAPLFNPFSTEGVN